MSDKIIMYGSPDAASIRTVTGWVSSKGHFFGDNEDMARYDGCTHRECKMCANGISTKHRTACDECSEKSDVARYQSKQRKDWNGTDFLYSDANDVFFSDFDELADYCDEHETSPELLRLIICEPVYLCQITEDYWADQLAEDMGLPSAIAEALDNLNVLIREHGPVSWEPGKFAPTNESISIKD